MRSDKMSSIYSAEVSKRVYHAGSSCGHATNAAYRFAVFLELANIERMLMRLLLMAEHKKKMLGGD